MYRVIEPKLICELFTNDKIMNDARGVECLWGNPINYPHCPHGNFFMLYIKFIIFIFKKIGSFRNKLTFFCRTDITIWKICRRGS